MKKNRQGLLFEVLLILILSLLLSSIYNTVSPTGIDILPKKIFHKKTDMRKSFTEMASANNVLLFENNNRKKEGMP